MPLHRRRRLSPHLRTGRGLAEHAVAQRACRPAGVQPWFASPLDVPGSPARPPSTVCHRRRRIQHVSRAPAGTPHAATPKHRPHGAGYHRSTSPLSCRFQPPSIVLNKLNRLQPRRPFITRFGVVANIAPLPEPIAARSSWNGHPTHTDRRHFRQDREGVYCEVVHEAVSHAPKCDSSKIQPFPFDGDCAVSLAKRDYLHSLQWGIWSTTTQCHDGRRRRKGIQEQCGNLGHRCEEPPKSQRRARWLRAAGPWPVQRCRCVACIHD